MTEIPEFVRDEARKELARRFFYDYCQYRYPTLYKEDRQFLKELCEGIQRFTEQNEKRFLVINMPPRHYKSLTGTNLVEWLFGQDPNNKVMTGSYNETLSTTFAKKVRDVIDERKSKGSKVYNDIFPNTKVKYGQASKSLWALEGSPQDNYLATSPTGTATGFGANFIVLDDIIKNAIEAFNRNLLAGHWDWFTNTMMSRTEGDDWKVIAIMTRWAKEDLAGKIIEEYGDLVEVIQFRAVQDDGSMLCSEILNATDYEIKTRRMAREIIEANYNQKPIDVEGKLYQSFNTWDALPVDEEGKEIPMLRRNFTDVADQGKDFLCSVNWFHHGDFVYITDLYISDEDAEITEPKVAELLHTGEINEAEFESNNGGKGYARNVERESLAIGNNRTVITWTPQTSNKEARILASSAWNQKHILMPKDWETKYPQFFEQVMSYQKKGKNLFDDAPDVLASIYERAANFEKLEWAAPRMG